MAKDVKKPQVDNLTEIESALTRTEQFLEKNQKLIGIVIGAIVVVAVGYQVVLECCPFSIGRHVPAGRRYAAAICGGVPGVKSAVLGYIVFISIICPLIFGGSIVGY